MLGSSRVATIGLDPHFFGTHSLRRTKATLIYRRTSNLRAVQLLLVNRTRFIAAFQDERAELVRRSNGNSAGRSPYMGILLSGRPRSAVPQEYGSFPVNRTPSSLELTNLAWADRSAKVRNSGLSPNIADHRAAQQVFRLTPPAPGQQHIRCAADRDHHQLCRSPCG